ncbi:RND efflux system, outer membrane lipoprotein [Pseudomonas syringae pv. coriandricola]|nr:RND efflux system, outer membrane lipoprotein [Pseudomonas syringae pv. coriandricola]
MLSMPTSLCSDFIDARSSVRTPSSMACSSPRNTDSGVRSSWDTSAMNSRRIFSHTRKSAATSTTGRSLISHEYRAQLGLNSHALGGSSGLQVAQAQTTVESARGDVAQYQSRVLQDCNALRLLVGSDIPDARLPAADAQSVAGSRSTRSWAAAGTLGGFSTSLSRNQPLERFTFIGSAVMSGRTAIDPS